jgi:hypothetical protein
MTEQEWLACTDPKMMLEFLRGKASDRKFRLIAVACWRRVWHPLTYKQSPDGVEIARYVDENPLKYVETYKQRREAVKIAEQVADGLVSDSTRQAVWEVVDRRLEQAVAESDFAWAVFVRDTQRPVSKDVIREILFIPERYATPQLSRDMCRLLRDVFGPLPFRPISIDPAWLTWHNGLLVSMARQMYDSRGFRDMAVLADALLEAGCANPSILNHCRSRGEHVRGCWVVDLLLGKS